MNKVPEVIQELETNKGNISLHNDSLHFIALIAKAMKAKNVLEIGTFQGRSSLFLSLFADNLTTLEINKESAQTAKENFDKAGVHNIDLIQGDAREILKKLNKKFDIILIDAKKSEYTEYLNLSLKLLNKNGIIFADNTISHKNKMNNFFEFLRGSDLFYQELNLGKGLMLISRRFSFLKPGEIL